MRITHRMIAGGIQHRLGQSLNRLERYSQQLATGKVFQRPSQNPVGLVKVLRYSTLIERNERYRLNMNEAARWLESTEDSLRDALDSIERLRELCIYGANEVLTAADRHALAPETLELSRFLFDLANKEYNGLYLFAGHNTLETPFVERNLYRIEADEDSGLDPASLQAEGLQNGTYRLALRTIAGEAHPAELETVQACLGDAAAGSIFGAAVSTAIDPEIDQNASILLEVLSADGDTGEVRYRFTVHRYDRDGAYHCDRGEASLVFGGPAEQSLDLGGGIVIAVGGLETASPAQAGLLGACDRAVLNLLPERLAAQEYQEVRLSGEHCGGEASFRLVFDAGTLQEGSNLALHYFTMNTFPRSPFLGEAHHGSVSLGFGGSFVASDAAAVFHYDREGFPVYRGDDGRRELDISPHQVLALNLTGQQAFGKEQEIFQAARAVYHALIENDRTRLGGAILDDLDHAVDLILQRLSEVGARQKRVETMQETLFCESMHLREMRSQVEDIDLALTIAEFTMQENAYQAALATAARIMPLSLVDYLR